MQIENEMLLMWYLVGTVVVFSMFVGLFAASRGRTGFGWFLLSLITSPVLTFIVLLALNKYPPKI